MYPWLLLTKSTFTWKELKLTKIVTLVIPFYINNIDRKHVTSVLEALNVMGGVIRSNGNGGKNGVLSNLKIDEKDKVYYLPSPSFYSLGQDPRIVITDDKREKADIFLATVFNNYDKYPDKDKEMLRVSLFSLAGLNLDSKSDIAVVYRPPAKSEQHPCNQRLYSGAIRIANYLRIKIININSRLGVNNNGKTSSCSDQATGSSN